MAELPSGKRSLKPSFAAAPGLSVTPGLNPTVMVNEGGMGKNVLSFNNDVFVAPCSMIGSEKISCTRGSIAPASYSLRIRYPRMLRTFPTSIP